MRKTIFGLLSFTCLWLLARPVAAADFESYYKTSYLFDQNGLAHVTQEISVVNQLADRYVSQYSLTLTGEKIDKIAAYDQVGPLKVASEKRNGTTAITVNFNQKVVGRGQVLAFILKYQAQELAQKKGYVWELTLPKLSRPDYLQEYQVGLRVPKSFGKPASMTPSPRLQSETEDFYLYEFAKADLVKYGVLATFGDYQYYGFVLQYHLKNDSLDIRQETVALPPDTAYQKVYFEEVNPTPLSTTVDRDGNWLATYNLLPGQKQIVTLKGTVKIFATPQRASLLSAEERQTYTQAQAYWPTADEQIRRLAQRLKTPAAIYDYVVQTLKYDYTKITSDTVRLGATRALADPEKALCTEFTDLFVALARAAGIPTRELQGYALTDNKKISAVAETSDVLHSWPEYYHDERKQWVMVDPTWGDTTGGLDFFNNFDSSHFVFAIHGANDIYPLPAGSYKYPEDTGKQIKVYLAGEPILPPGPAFSLETNRFRVFSLLKNPLAVRLKNISGRAWYDQTFDLSSGEQWFYGAVPPLGRIALELYYQPRERFADYRETLVLTSPGQVLYLEIEVRSVALRAGGVLGVAVSAGLLILLVKMRQKDENLASKYDH